MKCKHCNKEVKHLKRHEDSCQLRPENKMVCLQCGCDFYPKYESKGTCSVSCSNTYFRSGEDNGNWKQDCYRTTCFLHHKKECIICAENKLVEVHHYNEDHSDNRIENLVPMCPTHHQYMHSRFKTEIQGKVSEYVRNFIKR